MATDGAGFDDCARVAPLLTVESIRRLRLGIIELLCKSLGCNKIERSNVVDYLLEDNEVGRDDEDVDENGCEN